MSSTTFPDPRDTSYSLPAAKIVGRVEGVIQDENSVIIGPYQEGYVQCTFKIRMKRSWQERVMNDDDHPWG